MNLKPERLILGKQIQLNHEKVHNLTIIRNTNYSEKMPPFLTIINTF
jgi:hypothetical protein